MLRAIQVSKATKAKPAHFAATVINRVPGASVTAYMSKGVVYVSVPGALVPGPFAVPKKKTVLRVGTAVRCYQRPHLLTEPHNAHPPEPHPVIADNPRDMLS